MRKRSSMLVPAAALLCLALSFAAGYADVPCDTKCATYGKDYSNTWRVYAGGGHYTCYNSVMDNFSYMTLDSKYIACCRKGVAGECKNTTTLSYGVAKTVNVYLLCTKSCTSGCLTPVGGSINGEPATGGTLDGTTTIAHNLCDTTGS